MSYKEDDMRDEAQATDLKRHTEATFKRGVAFGRAGAFEDMKPSIDRAYLMGRAVRRKEIISAAVLSCIGGVMIGFTIALAAMPL